MFLLEVRLALLMTRFRNFLLRDSKVPHLTCTLISETLQTLYIHGRLHYTLDEKHNRRKHNMGIFQPYYSLRVLF